jgi:hypothetical protein
LIQRALNSAIASSRVDAAFAGAPTDTRLLVMQTLGDREAHFRTLAERLSFSVEKIGDRFTLKRTADVSEPVCEQNLTLTEAEQLLQRWKLRGFHGG